MTVMTNPSDRSGRYSTSVSIMIPKMVEIWSGDQEASARVEKALAKLPDDTKYYEARRIAQEAARVGHLSDRAPARSVSVASG